MIEGDEIDLGPILGVSGKFRLLQIGAGWHIGADHRAVLSGPQVQARNEVLIAVLSVGHVTSSGRRTTSHPAFLIE